MQSRLCVLAVLTLSASVTLSGCAGNSKVEDESQCKVVKPGTVTSINKMCAVMPQDPVDPAVATVAWKDQQVGFCCKGCVPRWNKMTDAQKDAALAKAMATPVPQQ